MAWNELTTSSGPATREKAFIKAGAEIPVIALVVFVAVKTPDTVDHDHRADAIVPEVAEEMETQICPRVGSP
jgi:hypothetical protein